MGRGWRIEEEGGRLRAEESSKVSPHGFQPQS